MKSCYLLARKSVKDKEDQMEEAKRAVLDTPASSPLFSPTEKGNRAAEWITSIFAFFLLIEVSTHIKLGPMLIHCTFIKITSL